MEYGFSFTGFIIFNADNEETARAMFNTINIIGELNQQRYPVEIEGFNMEE
jgi:hypothetical protein